MFSQLYTDYFRHKLWERSQHPVSNFVVQHLLSNANHEAQIQMIFEELKPHIPNLIEQGKLGVLLRLVQGCHKFHVKEKELCKVLFQQVQSGTSVVCYLLELKHNDVPQKKKFSNTIKTFFFFFFLLEI